MKMSRALAFWFFMMGVYCLVGTVSAMDMEPTGSDLQGDFFFGFVTCFWFWLAYELYHRRRAGRVVAIIVCSAGTLAAIWAMFIGGGFSFPSMSLILSALPLFGLLHPRLSKEIKQHRSPAPPPVATAEQ